MDFHNIYEHGFARVAACTERITIADPEANAEALLRQARACDEEGVAVALFPELCLTGYSIVQANDLAAAVTHRLFPWAPAGYAPWGTFLWCTDRIALPDRAKIGPWGTFPAPLSEWPGGDRPPRTWPE